MTLTTTVTRTRFEGDGSSRRFGLAARLPGALTIGVDRDRAGSAGGPTYFDAINAVTAINGTSLRINNTGGFYDLKTHFAATTIAPDATKRQPSRSGTSIIAAVQVCSRLR